MPILLRLKYTCAKILLYHHIIHPHPSFSINIEIYNKEKENQIFAMAKSIWHCSWPYANTMLFVLCMLNCCSQTYCIVSYCIHLECFDPHNFDIFKYNSIYFALQINKFKMWTHVLLELEKSRWLEMSEKSSCPIVLRFFLFWMNVFIQLCNVCVV